MSACRTPKGKLDKRRASGRKQHVPTLDLFFLASLKREMKAVRPDLIVLKRDTLVMSLEEETLTG